MKFGALFLVSNIVIYLLGCTQLKKIPSPHGVKPDAELATLTLVKDLDPSYRPGNLPIGLSSPVIHNKKILAGTAKGEFLEIDANSLKEKILYQVDAPIYAPILVHESFYYIGTLNGDLIGWSTNEGVEKFKVNLGAPIEAPMGISEGRIIVALRNHTIVCLDSLTGKVIWNYKRPVTTVKTLQRRSGALLIGKSAIVGFADGHLISFRLEDGNIQWENKVTEAESRHFQDVIATPTYFEGRILTYSFQGYLKAYKLDSGALEKTVLEKPTSNLLIQDGHVYFANTLGDVVKLNSKFELTTHFKKLSSSPVYQLHYWKKYIVANDHKGHVFWINAQQANDLQKKFFLGHIYSTVFGSMSSDQNSLTLISSRNRLYLFQEEVF